MSPWQLSLSTHTLTSPVGINMVGMDELSQFGQISFDVFPAKRNPDVIHWELATENVTNKSRSGCAVRFVALYMVKWMADVRFGWNPHELSKLINK